MVFQEEIRDNSSDSKRPCDSFSDRGTGPRNKKRRLEESKSDLDSQPRIPPSKIVIDLTEDDAHEDGLGEPTDGLGEPTNGLDCSKSPGYLPTTPVGEALRKIDRCFGSMDVELKSLNGFKSVQKDRPAKLTKMSETALAISDRQRNYIGLVPPDDTQVIEGLLCDYSVEVDLFIPKADLQPTDDRKLLVCLHLYGSEQDSEVLSEFLTSNNKFLQDPVRLRKSIKYENPQAWKVPLNVQEMLDVELDQPVQEEFQRHENEIKGIFDADSIPSAVLSDSQSKWPTPDISPRIRTKLLETQLRGVQYMLQREARAEFLPRLWNRDTQADIFECILSEEIVNNAPHIPRGGILADEMGLGKTLTALALIASSLDFPRPEDSRPPLKTTLVVTPTITIASWKEQIRKHTSGLKVLYYDDRNIRDAFGSYDIVITTYGMVSAERRGTLRRESLQDPIWFRIILDEAHTIRNRNAAQSKLICNLKSDRRWCLTGTPTQNRLDDLGSLLKFLRLEPIQIGKEFTKLVIKPLQQKSPTGYSNLRRVIEATTLRRTKKLMANTALIPERKDVVQRLTLSEPEMQLYKSISSQTLRDIEKMLNEGAHSIRMASQYLIRLRQVCNDRRLLPRSILENFDKEMAPNEGGIPHANACENCGNEIRKEAADFGADCEHTICKKCSIDGKHCPCCYAVEELDQDSRPPTLARDFSSMSSLSSMRSSQTADWGRSSKMTALVDNLLRNKRSLEKPKSVVFACWKRMLDIIGEALNEEDIGFARLDGSMNLAARIAEIERFRNNPKVHVIIITIGSGSVGLDLTAASQVHIVEPQYNPMQEEQALARVHRIGQTSPVTTVRYIVEDTYEQQMQALQEEKMQLAELCSGGKDGKAKLQALKAVLR